MMLFTRFAGSSRAGQPSAANRAPLRAATLVVVAALLAACASPEERAAGYIESAQRLLAEGNYVKAKLEAQNAAQIQPRNATAHFLLAQVAEQEQEFRTMIQQLMAAVEIDPNLVEARVKLGTLYFFGQVFDKAAEQAEAARKLAPDNPEVRVLNARLLLQRKDTAAGIAELDAALATQPDLIDALLLRAAATAVTDPGRGISMLDEVITRLGATNDKVKPLRQLRIAILAQQKRQTEVEQGLRDMIRDFPKEQEYQYQLARYFASQGRVDEAEEVMRGAVALDADDVTARLGLAQFLAQMRSPEAAEQALEAFIAEGGDAAQPELRLALGRLYESNGKTDAALAVYEELGKRDPKSSQGLAARVRLAALRIGKGEIEAGAKLIDAVLADQPDHADALLIRAGLRVRDRKLDEAIADVRTALRKEPQNQRAMLLLARTHAIANERVLAKDAYRRLLDLDPKNPDAPRELAALEAMDQNFDVAEEVLRARLALDPGDLDTGARLVDLLASQKAWDEAEAEAKRLVALPDDKGIGQFQLARLYRAQKRQADAVAAFRKALERNPEWTLALEGLAGTLNEMGRRDEALAVVQEFLKKNPDNLSARFLEGGVRAGKGDVAEAEKIYNEIVSARPDASKAWAALASLNRDNPDARIAAYKRGLAANPGNAELGLLLGSEYEAARRIDEAIAHYEELLKVNPGVSVAANNLAALLLDYRSDAQSRAQALELAKKLEDSTNPAVLDTVGWAYYHNKAYARAVPFLERAVAGAGHVPLLHYHLGMAYLANGNSVGAKQELGRAVADANTPFPGIDEARETLKKL